MTKVFVISDKDFPKDDNVSPRDTNQPTSPENDFVKSEDIHKRIIARNVEPEMEFSNNSTNSDKNVQMSKGIVNNRKRSNTGMITGTISDIDSLNNEGNSENEEPHEVSLKAEKITHQEVARKREEIFKSIVSNNEIELSSMRLTLYPIFITLVGFSFTIPFSLIPAHDLILFPEYWYEAIFHGLMASSCFFTYQCVLAGSVFNLRYPLVRNNILHILFVGNAVTLCLIIFPYFIWTQIFNYQFPIPFLNLILMRTLKILSLFLIWLKFPQEWRKNEQFKRRMGFYCLFDLFNFVMVIFYEILWKKIRETQDDYQPFAALALPVMREFAIWMGSKLIENCCDGDTRGAKIFLQYMLSVRHTLTLCNFLGSSATETTSLTLMGIDFSLNILLSLWIVWKKKRHPNNVLDQIDSLQDLALYELVEFYTPLSFIMVIAVAYFGPNASIFGNISNSYWTYTAIEDINQTLSIMGQFFLIDFGSTIMSAMILWLCCRINLWVAIIELQIEFGKAFCITLGHFLVSVI